MAETTNQKIERKYLAHYIDASFNGTTVNYVRLGKDLEEYAIELNPDSETKKNILGENSTNVKGYEPQALLTRIMPIAATRFMSTLRRL